jgi:hypothetical protein
MALHPAGSPGIRLREGRGTWEAVRRRLRRGRGEACLRRGAAAHPPLPLEAPYSPRVAGT